ncbi:uncharacterized protein [Linepithema humile]
MYSALYCWLLRSKARGLAQVGARRMWLSKTLLLLIFLGLTSSEKNEDDVSIEDDLARAFTRSDTGKMILSGISSLMSGQNNQGFDMSMVGSIVSAMAANNHGRSTKDIEHREEQGIDWDNIVRMGSMFFQQNVNNDMVMGLIPMLLDAMGHSTNDNDAGIKDHSGHSWFLPPVLENIHVMWEHFSNSELGQMLWKNSGLSKIIAHMTDENGNILWEKILESFENPMLRRRWVKSLTNFVAEWISHVSDPMNQQRYLTTAQFIGNSFLKSQGFPKTMMFDATRPTESLSRLANGIAKRYLNMNIDTSKYVRPAIAYFQELVNLASEKGFIMSRVNARELSNRLSDVINNDLISPILKSYRAYKWATKVPHCASQILCTINEKSQQDDSNESRVRSGLLKVASFPAAWGVSHKLGINFWSLYGAIMENDGCISKYPADCTAFHEEEIRVTTENIHNEL